MTEYYRGKVLIWQNRTPTEFHFYRIEKCMSPGSYTDYPVEITPIDSNTLHVKDLYQDLYFTGTVQIQILNQEPVTSSRAPHCNPCVGCGKCS